MDEERLGQWFCHVEAKRTAKAERSVQYATVHAADDEHQALIMSFSEEAQYLDPIAAGHTEIYGDRVGRLIPKILAEAVDAGRAHRPISMFFCSMGDEASDHRVVVDEKQRWPSVLTRSGAVRPAIKHAG